MEQRMPVFKERFTQLRGNMTQAQFADFLGISRPTIGFYESGSRIPDAIGVRNIAEKCKVSADWLLGLSETRSPDGDLQQACNYTGLSETTIDRLREDYEFPVFCPERLEAPVSLSRFVDILFKSEKIYCALANINNAIVYLMPWKYFRDFDNSNLPNNFRETAEKSGYCYLDPEEAAGYFFGLTAEAINEILGDYTHSLIAKEYAEEDAREAKKNAVNPKKTK